MTHAQGVLLWDGVSATPPTALYSCPSLCSNYSFGVAGPAGDVYAVCTDAAGAGRRHLVHMRGGDACSIVIDGTSFGTRTLNEIVLAHAAL